MASGAGGRNKGAQISQPSRIFSDPNFVRGGSARDNDNQGSLNCGLPFLAATLPSLFLLQEARLGVRQSIRFLSENNQKKSFWLLDPLLKAFLCIFALRSSRSIPDSLKGRGKKQELERDHFSIN